MNRIYVAIFVILTLLVLLFFFYAKMEEQRKALRSLKLWKRSIETKYQRKQGTTKALNSKKEVKYDLRSFDGGKNWYACEEVPEKGLIIIGKADDVYQGIVHHLHSWNSIVEKVNVDGHL